MKETPKEWIREGNFEKKHYVGIGVGLQSYVKGFRVNPMVGYPHGVCLSFPYEGDSIMIWFSSGEAERLGRAILEVAELAIGWDVIDRIAPDERR